MQGELAANDRRCGCASGPDPCSPLQAAAPNEGVSCFDMPRTPHFSRAGLHTTRNTQATVLAKARNLEREQTHQQSDKYYAFLAACWESRLCVGCGV